MAKVIVLGGGVCGLAASLMLARDGHRVTVLERDPAPPPETPEHAWERWDRDGGRRTTSSRVAGWCSTRSSRTSTRRWQPPAR